MLHCQACQSNFSPSAQHLHFLDTISPTFSGKKFSIPAPRNCPDCRQRRRLTWRNERTLYYRPSASSGKNILTMYGPTPGHSILERDEFYSDNWDPLSYGRDYDFKRPFFEQFGELLKTVPMLAINHQANNENCEFTNFVSYNKDCFYIFAANENDCCFYSTYLQRNKHVGDSFFIFDSELCYDCVDCYRCTRLRYSQYCENCSDSSFLFNCRSCRDCFGCAALVQKQNYFFNEELSPASYKEKVKEFCSQPDWVEAGHQRLSEIMRAVPHKFMAGIQNEEVSGDHVSFSRRVASCFDCTYLEDCAYCTWLHKGKDCYDCYAWGLSAELGYENHLCGNNFYNVQFSDSCWNDISNLQYCRYCTNNASDLFGCIGLRGKHYCILNKQYSKAQYEELLPRIIAHMQSTSEYGEFFPAQLSPFAYNETIAQEYFPLDKAQVVQRKLRWLDQMPGSKGKETHSFKALHGLSFEDLMKCVLACSRCAKNFKFQKAELELYQNLEVPFPELCFDCRHQNRLRRRNPRKLWERQCSKCGVRIYTSYEAERPEKIMCEKCFGSVVLA